MTSTSEQNSPPKIAIITGGSRGLGRNTALNLAQRGVDLIITYHTNRAEADVVVEQIQGLGRSAVALQLDSGDVASFDGFAAEVKQVLHETWGRDRFDFLVNNAGVALTVPFAQTTEEDFDRLCNIHFKGVFFLTQKLLPLIVDGGRIVNISTGLTRFSLPGHSAYASMKGAIEVMTRYLARELGTRGIAVNAVAPGTIATDFGGGAVRDNADTNQFIAASTAMGRAGVPDDIGPMIALLLSPENRWVAGQRIEASGGMFL